MLDELSFPAAFGQLVVVFVAGEKNSLQKSLASVSNENKAGFLALLVRMAWKSHRELVFFSVFAAKGNDSGFQLLDGVATRFQRSIPY